MEAMSNVTLLPDVAGDVAVGSAMVGDIAVGAGDVDVGSTTVGEVAVGAGDVAVGGEVGVAASPPQAKPTIAVTTNARDRTQVFFTLPPLWQEPEFKVACIGEPKRPFPSVKFTTLYESVQHFTISFSSVYRPLFDTLTALLGKVGSDDNHLPVDSEASPRVSCT